MEQRGKGLLLPCILCAWALHWAPWVGTDGVNIAMLPALSCREREEEVMAHGTALVCRQALAAPGIKYKDAQLTLISS